MKKFKITIDKYSTMLYYMSNRNRYLEMNRFSLAN